MNTKTTLSIVVIAAITLSLAFSSVLIASEASAKITPVCKNPSGGEPQGKCQGSALTEENQNPSGKAPPGQN